MESGLYIPKGGSTTPRLKAAKVPGHAGSHTTPPGASDNVALKRKRSMQDSVQHLRRLASEKSAQLGQLTTSNLSAVHTKGGQAGVSQRLASQLRHAATMESSSPDSFSSHSPLDTPAGDVRQRLLFDCHESRFGESAEPDPLSFGSPQRAEHAQQAEQHDLGAINSSFQAFSLQSSLSSPRLLHQSSAPSSGLATPQPLERNHSTGLQLQRSGGDSDQGEDRDSLGASPMRQALDSERGGFQDVPRAEHQLKQKVWELEAALEAKRAVCDRQERQLQLSANQLQRQHNVEERYNEAQRRLRSAETNIQGLQANVQARDDSIAGFQMLQQQGPSPGQKERLAALARQLEDTQAQLLATQAQVQERGGESDRLQAALQNQQLLTQQLQDTEEKLQRQGQQLQGEQQEADELRRLHLRLERANEHADQLAVLQAEVDQLRCSLVTAEKSLATAESSAGGISGQQVQELQREVGDLKSELQQHSDKVAQAEARVQEHQSAAREAFQQASAHARSAQQAEARCQVLEQAVQRAERKAESTAHVQQEVLDLQLAVQMRDDHLAECQRQSELDQLQIDDLERQLLMQAADEEELVHLENLPTQSQAAEAEAIRQAGEATQRLSAASVQHVSQLESELQQAKLQLQRLQEQMKVLTEERDTMANALEAKESQLLGLQAQVDLLRNHNSETEAWLTSM
ncbi:hypothetical protein WJX79_006964 [Trebouxia sp. C0005]